MVLLFIEFSNSPTKLPWHIPPDTIIKLQSNKKGTWNLIEKAQDSMNCAAFCDRLSASMQHRKTDSHSHAGEIILILCKKCISHSGDNNIRGGGGGGQFPCWAWVEGGLVSSCPIFFLNFSLIDFILSSYPGWFCPIKFCHFLRFRRSPLALTMVWYRCESQQRPARALMWSKWRRER